jgi:hypothetical protein
LLGVSETMSESRRFVGIAGVSPDASSSPI